MLVRRLCRCKAFRLVLRGCALRTALCTWLPSFDASQRSTSNAMASDSKARDVDMSMLEPGVAGGAGGADIDETVGDSGPDSGVDEEGGVLRSRRHSMEHMGAGKPRKRAPRAKFGMAMSDVAGLARRATFVIKAKPTKEAMARRSVEQRSEFTHPDGLSYCVVVDGSKQSHEAFLEAADMMAPNDSITLLHPVDPEAEPLRAGMKNEDVIDDKYETACVTRFNSERARIVHEPLKPHESVHDAVCRYVNSNGFEMLVVPLMAARGPGDKDRMLGDDKDYSVRHAFVTTLIVRHQTVDSTGGFGSSAGLGSARPRRSSFVRAKRIYAVGVDGSLHAHNALIVARRLAQSSDEVHAVHVHRPAADDERSNEIMRIYRKEIENSAARAKALGKVRATARQLSVHCRRCGLTRPSRTLRACRPC